MLFLILFVNLLIVVGWVFGVICKLKNKRFRYYFKNLKSSCIILKILYIKVKIRGLDIFRIMKLLNLEVWICELCIMI